MHHLGCLLPERNPICLPVALTGETISPMYLRVQCALVPRDPGSYWWYSLQRPACGTQPLLPHACYAEWELSSHVRRGIRGLRQHAHLPAHLSCLALAASQFRQRRQLSKPLPVKSSRIAPSHCTPNSRVPMLLWYMDFCERNVWMRALLLSLEGVATW